MMTSYVVPLTVFFLLPASSLSRNLKMAQNEESISQFGSQIFNDFGEVTEFLRHWFSAIRQTLARTTDANVNTTTQVHDIHKRQVTPPPKFEDAERVFLYNMSVNYFKLFAGYVKYVSKNNETKTFMEDMVRSQGEKLNHMSTDQMRKYVGNLMTTMTAGVNSKHEIVIGGNTYSLDHISSWCCPF